MKSGVVATDSFVSFMYKETQNTQDSMDIHIHISILSVEFMIS